MSRSLVFVSVSLFLGAVTFASGLQAASDPSPTYVAPAGSGALFLVSGHGWGHGVGMGQWGAEGYALQSYTYPQILAAYYPGTTLGQSSVATIRVLLADGKKSLTIASAAPLSVTDGDGVVHSLPAGKTKLTPSLTLPVDGNAAQALARPLTFAPADGSTLTLGRPYRGQILVDVVQGKLRAINVVPLEDYLYGVVPAEMSSSWLPAALEAQAVASRSYAIAGRRAGAPFDVYADTRSQAYLGVSVETPEANAAVDATAGQVVLYDGQVATTVYSSSTGGWTQSAADAWGGQGAPYLVSVRDPYDTISPYHDWGPVTVTGKALAQALGLAGRVEDATATPDSSRRVATLTLTSVAGGKTSTTPVSGGKVAAALALRSTWFSVGVLSLQPPLPNRPVRWGTKVTLTGAVRGVTGAAVQARSRGAPWTQLAPATPDPKTGTFSLTVKPKLTTAYRLATDADAAASVRIRLEPRVLLSSAGRHRVSGRVRPRLPGAKVLVQQQLTAGSHKWATVVQGTVGGKGRFSVAASLAAGPTRVVVAPGNGWWPGASTAATVK